MGGHSAGEVASARAIAALDTALSSKAMAAAASAEGMEHLLRAALDSANERVLALSRERPQWSGAGTTVVIGAVRGRTLHVANLGDSRAYLIRGSETSVLTVDHSLAAEWEQQGLLDAKRARHHPLRNQLTACLGMRGAITPAYRSLAVEREDCVVLCSDGLWDMLPDPEIARITRESSTPEEAVAALAAAANDAGGADNITAIVVWVASGPATERATRAG